MFNVVKVRLVGYSDLGKCVTIEYIDKDETVKYAACSENLTVKVGDIVEVYRDDAVNYKGFGAIALKVISQNKKNSLTLNIQIADLIKKYKRKLQKYQIKESNLEERKEKLSVNGFWSLGYYGGRSSLAEDIVDDLESLLDESAE